MNLYEDERLADMPDGALRPGGLGLTRELIRLSGLAPGSSVLDVGCGFGRSAGFLASVGYDVTGIDISEKLIKQASERFPEVRFSTADAAKMPFEASRFDAVIFECVLSLIDTHSALREARRVLRPGGVLLVSDVFSGIDGHRAEAKYFLEPSDFNGQLVNLDFEVSAAEDRTGVLRDFYAQLIMSTGSADSILRCDERAAIKRIKPRYLLMTCHRVTGETVADDLPQSRLVTQSR